MSPMPKTETGSELGVLEDALRAEIRSAAREIRMVEWQESAALRREIRVLQQQISDLKQEVVAAAPRRTPRASKSK